MKLAMKPNTDYLTSKGTIRIVKVNSFHYAFFMGNTQIGNELCVSTVDTYGLIFTLTRDLCEMDTHPDLCILGEAVLEMLLEIRG